MMVTVDVYGRTADIRRYTDIRAVESAKSAIANQLARPAHIYRVWEQIVRLPIAILSWLIWCLRTPLRSIKNKYETIWYEAIGNFAHPDIVFIGLYPNREEAYTATEEWIFERYGEWVRYNDEQYLADAYRDDKQVVATVRKAKVWIGK